MPIILYDLAGADPELRFSPYCWRVKLALRHKELTFETIPWRFTEPGTLAFSGQKRVPVIVDGERALSDSWAIANYLEERYPAKPSLFGGGSGQAHANFINAWADTVLQPAIAQLIVRDVVDVLGPEDKHYFRHTRERAFGMTLEEVVAGREHKVEAFRSTLAPMRRVFKTQPWLGGAAPDYADYIVLSSLLWARCSSRFALLEADDPVSAWHTRGLALFDGFAAGAKTP